MSTKPRLIPDAECAQGKCSRPTTGCWDECAMKHAQVTLGHGLIVGIGTGVYTFTSSDTRIADLETTRATIRVMDKNKAMYLAHIAELETALAHVVEPKLVLALPDHEKRRIVIASDEVIDEERIVCVAIEGEILAASGSTQPSSNGYDLTDGIAKFTELVIAELLIGPENKEMRSDLRSLAKEFNPAHWKVTTQAATVTGEAAEASEIEKRDGPAELLAYIEGKHVLGASYGGISSLHVMVNLDDYAVGGAIYAIECVKERDQSRAAIKAMAPVGASFVIFCDQKPIDVAVHYREVHKMMLPPTPTMQGMEIKHAARSVMHYQLYIDNDAPGDFIPVSDMRAVPLQPGMRFVTIPPATF